MDQMGKSVSCRQRQRFSGLRRHIKACALTAMVFAVGFAPLSGSAESNLQQDYPAHQCGERPEPPERPEKFRYRAELDAYNEKVNSYNAAMDKYVSCLQSYVNNAASDIRAIRQKIEAALQAANQ